MKQSDIEVISYRLSVIRVSGMLSNFLLLLPDDYITKRWPCPNN